MTHASDEPRPSVPSQRPTLEDLLRVKRAERPDAAFWQDFERGLRQKQLAAIIEPRPWWLGLALLGRRLTHLGLPLSAGAAALLAVLVLRTQAPFGQVAGPVEFGPGPVLDAHAPSGAVLSSSPVLAEASAASRTLPSLGEDAPETESGELLADTRPAPAAPSEETLVAPLAPEARPSALALPLEVQLAERPAAPTLSQLAIARNLAVVKAEEPDLLAAAAPSLVPVAVASSSAEEETPLRMVVFNPRHARALVALSDTPPTEAAGGLAHLRERLARSLDHSEALYGSASRLGVGGDRLSLSF